MSWPKRKCVSKLKTSALAFSTVGRLCQHRLHHVWGVQEECAAQQQKLREQNTGLEEESSKLRSAAEQHQHQLDAMRQRLEAADKKLEEEEQRRLQEVKEMQVGAVFPCCRA